MLRKIIYSCCALLMFWSHAVFAANFFNVVVAGPTLNINTNIPNQYYNNGGIKINSPNYTLTFPNDQCGVLSNAYCAFGVGNGDSTPITLTGPGGKVNISLCLNAYGPLTCEDFTNVSIQVAYVTNEAGSVSVCPVDSNGALDLGCQDSGASPPFNYPNAIVLNPVVPVAYVVNYEGSPPSISACHISSTTTLFDSCFSNFTFDFSYGGAAVSPDGKYIYISNYDNNLTFTNCFSNMDTCGSVERCSLSPTDGSIQSESCVDSGAGILEYPIGVTLNKAGTLGYITLDEPSNSVFICSINSSGFFTSCHNALARKVNMDSDFDGPIQVALNNAGTFAYVSNNVSGIVSKCVLSNDGQNFSSCADSGAIVPSCLDQCPAGLGRDTWGMTLNESRATAYISSTSTASVWQCTITNTGDLNNCALQGDGTFNETSAIALAQ